jgi:hypothetical protein
MSLQVAIKEKYFNSNLIVDLHTDQSEIYVIETMPESLMFNKYILIWGDYVANVWEEEFDLLSSAIARMATLLHINEREPEGEIIGFGQEPNEFVSVWESFIKSNTDLIDS